MAGIALVARNLYPYRISIENAAAPAASLVFMFYGAALVVFPVVLIYPAVIYWAFRGKVGTTTDYR